MDTPITLGCWLWWQHLTLIRGVFTLLGDAGRSNDNVPCRCCCGHHLERSPKAASVYQLSEIWPKGLSYSLQSTHSPDTTSPLKLVEFLLCFLTFTDPTCPEYPNPPFLQTSLDAWSLAWLPDQPQPSPFSEPPEHFYSICRLPFPDPFLYKPYVPY